MSSGRDKATKTTQTHDHINSAINELRQMGGRERAVWARKAEMVPFRK